MTYSYGKVMAARRFFNNFNIDLYLQILEAKELRESKELREKFKNKVKKHLSIKKTIKPKENEKDIFIVGSCSKSIIESGIY